MAPTTSSILKFTYFMVLFIISYFSYLPATEPDTLWTRTFGGDSSDIGYQVQQTIDSGFVIVGETKSFGAGNTDVYLIRTDSNGDTLWTKTFGGTFYDRGNSVQQTSDGGFIIVGETSSFGAGNADVYLIRTNSNGDTLWIKTYGGDDSDRGYSIQKTSDDGFIIAGETKSFGAGYYDAYLIRTNSNGDTLWTKTYGGTGDDHSYSIYQTNDSGFVVAGQKEAFSAIDPDNIDAFLIRLNSNGDTLWTKTYDATDYDVGYSVQQTNYGGFIITGSIYDVDATTEDVYLIHTNSNGDTIWTRTFGGYSMEAGSCVKQTLNGEFIISGYTWSIGAGFYDVYLIRVDTEGSTLWEQTYGGTEYDEGNSIQQTSDGGFIIAGATQSFGAGGSDVYLIRLDTITTGIKKCNPANNFIADNYIVSFDYKNNLISIHYGVPYSSSVKIEAYDIQGKLVNKIVDKFLQKGYYSVKWDTKQGNNKSLAGGVYFLKLSVNGFALSRKVTIVR